MENNVKKSTAVVLGDALSQILSLGLTDREIAIICDVTPNAVNRWRHGANGVSKHREKALEGYLRGILMAESKTEDQRLEQDKVRKSIDADLEKLERLRTHIEPDVPKDAPKQTHRWGAPEGGIEVAFLVMVAPDRIAKFEKVMSMFKYEFVDFDAALEAD